MQRKTIKAWAVTNKFGIICADVNRANLAIYRSKKWAIKYERPFRWEAIERVEIRIIPSKQIRAGKKKSPKTSKAK